MKQWLTGISYECAFWNSLYRNKEQREGLFRCFYYGRELSPYIIVNNLVGYNKYYYQTPLRQAQ